MGLFDKVKKLFTEEEELEDEEEIKVEQIVKEPPKVHIEPKVKEVEKKKEVDIIKDEPDVSVKPEPVVVEEKKEEPQQLSREKTKTPIFFTEKDFDDLEQDKPKKVEKKREIEPIRQTVKKEEKKGPYGGAYSSPSLLTKEKPTFKPTPIISPIYGILDKNYSKEDIVERKDNNKPKEKHSDKFDEVRNKAYGSLENDLEESLYKEPEVKKTYEEEIDLFDELEKEQNVKEEKSVKIEQTVDLEQTAELAKTVNEQEKNIKELEEITMDLTKELDNLLLKRESYNQKKEKIEQSKSEDDELLTENELFNLIDSMYEEGKE